MFVLLVSLPQPVFGGWHARVSDWRSFEACKLFHVFSIQRHVEVSFWICSGRLLLDMHIVLIVLRDTWETETFGHVVLLGDV